MKLTNLIPLVFLSCLYSYFPQLRLFLTKRCKSIRPRQLGHKCIESKLDLEGSKMNSNGIGSDTWFLYLLLCKGGKTYTGITNNIISRYRAHKSGKGAKFTKANPPIELIGFKEYPGRSEASSAEYYFRKQPKLKKIEQMTFLG